MPTAPRARTLRTARRAVMVSVVVFGLVGAAGLGPDTSKVEASGLFGGLRSPGDAAFIASHRGDRSVAPENTMPALQAALEGPADFVEADIHLSRDGVPVLLHDFFVNRTSNGNGRVRHYTLAELRALDAGAWYSPEFAGTRIPTLESLLAALQAPQEPGSTPTKALLELKGYWTLEKVRIVTDLIADYDVGNLIIMSSFDTSTIQHLREADPALAVAILASRLPNDVVAFAELYGAVAIITNRKSLEKDPWVVDRMHRAGLGLVVYTLNSATTWKKALSLGVDGIITDTPNRLARWMSTAAR